MKVQKYFYRVAYPVKMLEQNSSIVWSHKLCWYMYLKTLENSVSTQIELKDKGVVENT